ncbi:MAG: hypothetical protein NVS4B11_03040 [Ktedonobacteraceae bacterium]
MPFSVLLLTAASSEKHISGHGGDKVSMSNLLSNEVVLFFDKTDREEVKRGLGMSSERKCCDGIIFYSNGIRKVICLVEMKSRNLGEAEEQIKSTYDRLRELMKRECESCNDYFEQIVWKAYVYRATGGPERQSEECVEKLMKYGFKKGNAVVLGRPDITNFLREDTRKEVFKKKKK